MSGKVATPNYSTRRAKELAQKPKAPALPKFHVCPERSGEDVVMFWLDGKTQAYPRLAQVRENPAKYAARLGLRPGPEFDAYVCRNVQSSPSQR